MINFFTDPYKDELIYSAIARYHFYLGNVDYRDTIEECFGKRSIIPSFEIGWNFEYLSKVLGKKYTSDKLIGKHTIMPYYSPFISEEVRNKTIHEIKYKGSYAIYTRLGIVAGAVCKKESIFYCPLCANNDLDKYGETYIHREHQLQGIILCPHHGVLLKEYSFKKLDVSRIEYIRLEEKYLDLKVEYNIIDDYNKHLKLARDSYYLLNANLSNMHKEKVFMKYRKLLFQKGLLKGNNTVNQRALYEEFINFYGERFLDKLESNINYYNEYNWLKVIARKSKRASHPLRHLLFINFLCGNIEEFFLKTDCIINEINKTNNHYSLENVNINKLNTYKEIILKEINNNNNLTRTQIRDRFQKEYIYLYRYDKEWLFNNLPEKTKIKQCNIRIDWSKRDKEYLKILKEKYKELINNKTMIRITKGSLSKPLGILSNIEKKLDKLPLTKKFLDEVCESTTDFQLRRGKNVIDTQIGKGIVRLWEVQRMAGIRSKHFKNIKNELQKYLDEKWMEINNGKNAT